MLYLLSVAHGPIGLLRNKITLPYHFVVIYELNTYVFLYYLRKNIIMSKHKLNICNLNFIFKKV